MTICIFTNCTTIPSWIGILTLAILMLVLCYLMYKGPSIGEEIVKNIDDYK